MNKVTTVNLNGNAFQLEESGYEALRAYLDRAAAELAGNPDHDEIMSDIEQAIADKLRTLLGAYKTVATAKQVEAVIAEMGPVDDGAEEADRGAATRPGPAAGDGGTAEQPRAAASGDASGARRIYRLYDGALISGVCNGLAAYFHIDPTLVRLIFIVLALLTSGLWILAYWIMIFVIPAADTPEKKNAAYGTAATAQDLIRRAKEGYYEGVKGLSDKAKRREWGRAFRRDMNAWAHRFQWDMRAGAEHWRQQWGGRPGACVGGSAGAALMVPVLCLLRAALALAFLVALVSLLTTGAVLGVVVPAGLPVWGATILLLVIYGVVTMPLKLARDLYRFQLSAVAPPAATAAVQVWEALVWLTFVGVVLWLVKENQATVMDAIHAIPPLFHQAVDAIRAWWNR